MLIFSFRTDPTEYWRASKELGRFAPQKAGAYLKLAGTLAILGVLVVSLYRSDSQFPWSILIGPTLLFAAIVGGIVIANRMRARRMGVDVREQTRVLSKSGLEVRNVRVVQVPWSSVPQVRESEEFFLFYLANMHGHYLPKRAIEHPSDLEAVRTLLRDELGSRFVEPGSVGAA